MQQSKNPKKKTEKITKKAKADNETKSKWKDAFKDEFSDLPGMSFLSNPYTAVAAGAAAAVSGIVILGSKAMEAGVHFSESKREVGAFMNELSGDKLEKVTSKIEAMVHVFGKDKREITQAGVALNRAFGGEAIENINKIQNAMVATNGALDLDYLKEYSTQFKEAGLNADQLLGLSVASLRSGVYQDKALDAVKEANIRLRDMPKAVTDTLKEMESVGAKFDIEGEIFNANKLKIALQKGEISTFQAMLSISKAMDKLNPTTRQHAIANIFGSPGEDAGKAFFDMINAGIPSMNKLISQNDEFTKKQRDQLEYREKINNEIAKFAPKMTEASTAVENLKLQMELFFYQTVAKGMAWWKENQQGVNAALNILKGSVYSLGLGLYTYMIVPVKLSIEYLDAMYRTAVGVVDFFKSGWKASAGGNFLEWVLEKLGDVAKLMFKIKFGIPMGGIDKGTSSAGSRARLDAPESSGVRFGKRFDSPEAKKTDKISPFSPKTPSSESGMKLPPSADEKGGGGTTATGGGPGVKNITILVQNRILVDVKKEVGLSIDEFSKSMAEALAREQRNVENM